ncbi:MAG TPA: transglycosylase SLT domain-containing protein [Blastocatellia bacterium]|nr:transglycosylase SLT domain-containing protein [Blastocatellia bacterium]
MIGVFAIALFIVLVLPADSAGVQSLQSRTDAIRAAMDGRDFDRAERLVRSLKASDPSAFTRNNYDYLLARLAERRGAADEASSLYLEVLDRNSILAQYALKRLAGIAQAKGDLALERKYLDRLVTEFPSSALTPGARDRLVENHHKSGDYKATIPLLSPIASLRGARGRSAMVRLGGAYSKAGDRDRARSIFEQLISGSRDDYALAAAEGLDSLDRAAGAAPSEFDALRRARIYLANRHWAQARAHLLYIIDRFPQSQNRAEATFQTGFTYYREDKFDEAIKWFTRAHAEFPSEKEGEQGYYYVGTALQKAQRYAEAAQRYIDFISEYPSSDLVEGAYRNAVDSLRYAGNIREARQWARRMGEVYARKPLASVALYNEAKIELVEGNFEAASALLTRLQAYPIYPRLVSAPIRGEAAFLRIYAIEQMGRIGEAARLYLAIPDERDNYFGYRATERLRALAATDRGRPVIAALARSYAGQARAALKAGRYAEAKDAATQALRITTDEASRRSLIEILRASYSQLPAYSSVWRYRLIPVGRDVIEAGDSRPSVASHAQLARELLFLGLYDEGASELRIAGLAGARTSDLGDEGQTEAGQVRFLEASATASASDVAYSMAVYSNRGDQSHYAIAFAEPLFKRVPQDYQLDLLPRDLVELLYPAPYRDALNRYGSALGVDPRLVLALARQESRFNPSVKSSAAARGLLQFIAETALRLADEEGIEEFELDDVYNPEIAIRLATRYVSDLLKLFPGNAYAAAASYNTGEQNVERWIFRARSNDVDRLLAEIAIPETKDYLAKVMNNYRAYCQLYTADLKPLR